MSLPAHPSDDQLVRLLAAVRAVLDQESAATIRTVEAALTEALADEPLLLTIDRVDSIVSEVRAMRRHQGSYAALAHAHLARWAAARLGDAAVQGHAWSCLSVTLQVVGHLTVAIPLHHETVDRFQHLVEQHRRFDLRPSLATALNDRGVTHEQSGQLEAAVDDYTAADAIYRG